MDRLLELLKEHSFEEKEVVLASGRRSTFFIDCKQTVLLAEGHVQVASALLKAIDSLSQKPRAVAGVELGGCPLASAVATVSALQRRPLDAIVVRKAVKDHGSARWVEGASHLGEGALVVVVEDVVTTGGSTLRAVQRLKDQGLAVIGVVALVDRNQGGREVIENEGLEFVSIYTRNDFMPDAKDVP